MADLWLVRHAQPLVGEGLCYGASDVPADAIATERAAQSLALQLPRGATVWCSTLARCRQLATALCVLRPDITWRTDPRLVEMDFGRWEGVRWDAIPRDAFDAWTNAFWDHRFGGRESVAEVMARVSAAWADARRTGGAIVWITHAGVIRAAGLLASGVHAIAHADEWPRETPAFGGTMRLAQDAGTSVAGGRPASTELIGRACR